VITGPNDNRGSPPRRLPLGVVALAMLAAASLPLGVATAFGAFEGSTEPDTADPHAAGHGVHPSRFNSNRQEIGRGDSAFGRYVIYTSTGPEGTCVELELPERNQPGERAFYSDCSQQGDPPVNSATLAGDEGTIIYGLVPEEATEVDLDRPGRVSLPATLHRGHRGEDRKFFVASSKERDVVATIRALGANGREIAARPAPRPGG